MSEALEVLKSVAKKLNEANFRYLVSGSMALNYYAVPRMTRDIDIVIVLTPLQTQDFVASFKNEFFVDEQMIHKEISSQRMFNIIHSNFLIKIDFMLAKDSEFQKTAFSRRKKIEIDSVPIWLISPEDLILAKLDWAKESFSEFQIRDVTNMIKTFADLDRHYLEQWIHTMHLEKIYARVTG